MAHLRPRTNLIGAVSRVRNALSYATHTFFQQRGFLYVNTPIITASDCEGAGEQFLVTTQIQADGKLPAGAGASKVDPAVLEGLKHQVAEQAAAVKALKASAEVNKDNVKAAVEVLLALKAQLVETEAAASAGGLDFTQDFFEKPAFLTGAPPPHPRSAFTLRARWVTLRACWVTLRARWVTLRARWVTLRARCVTLRGF